MALPQLTDEEVRTWTRAQKDRWWLEHVYRGDMPQLTPRSAVTGFLLGGALSATNLYIGAKTGWSLGVGVTSVILAFALFRTFGQLGLAKDFTILENNAVQSIATAAGYMTAPLVSALTAYMVMTEQVLPWWQMAAWTSTTSLLGVLVAFPMKRRFVNDEQQPFPEGRACAVVLDSLYPDAPQGGTKAAGAKPVVDDHTRWLGVLKARALFGAAAVAGFVQFLMLEGLQRLWQQPLLGRTAENVLKLPEHLLAGWYALSAKRGWDVPRILGTDIRQLGIDPILDVTMIGAGGLTGMRTANSLLLGCVLNWFVLAPTMIWLGEIAPKADGTFGRGYLLNAWCLWWGVAIMVTGSLTGLFSKPEVLLSAFRRQKQEGAGEDVLADIEFPAWISLVGVPVVSLISVGLNAWLFGINPLLGLLSIPLILVLTLIAANATGLTSTTPTGSLSKISQFTFGALEPGHPATNLITAGMTSEVASNASNLLMDIKPGYMLGARPRQQAWGHVLGIVSGAIASTLLFFPLFLPRGVDPSRPLAEQVQSEKFPMPSVDLWRGVAELIATGGADLKASALTAMLVAAGVGVAFELLRSSTKGKFPLSAVAIGLGVVIPVDSSLMMWSGALLFHWLGRLYERKPSTSLGRALWIDSHEPIAAGLVAGAALTGIADQLVTVFVLGN